MSYINTGYQRSKLLTIKITLNGVVQSRDAYPLTTLFTYNGVTYPELTPIQVQQMSVNDYLARVAAYAAFFQTNGQSQYPGLVVSSSGARVQNTIACPMP